MTIEHLSLLADTAIAAGAVGYRYSGGKTVVLIFRSSEAAETFARSLSGCKASQDECELTVTVP